MGTSQKYKASVAGQPNWGKMTSALMSLAASEAKDEELSQEEEQLEDELEQQQLSDTEQQPQVNITVPLTKRRKVLEIRRKRLNAQLDNNLRKSVTHAVKAAGGKKVVSSGRSYAFGHSGISTISNFVNNIVDSLIKSERNSNVSHRPHSISDYFIQYVGYTEGNKHYVYVNLSTFITNQYLKSGLVLTQDLDNDLYLDKDAGYAGYIIIDIQNNNVLKYKFEDNIVE